MESRTVFISKPIGVKDDRRDGALLMMIHPIHTRSRFRAFVGVDMFLNKLRVLLTSAPDGFAHLSNEEGHECSPLRFGTSSNDGIRPAGKKRDKAQSAHKS
jgi:hypothetical protein